MNQIQSKRAMSPVSLAALVVLICFALASVAQAVFPPPDGGYPGGNTAEGQNALFSLTTGTFNTAVGFLSLRSDTTGGFNTAIGAGALLANTANENTATGAAALLNNTTGPGNTADGAFALFSNTVGNGNTATGFNALFRNTEGNVNTATGIGALLNNTQGDANTATGAFALLSNTIGINNTATGFQALQANTSGLSNVATGHQALESNTTGHDNVAIGAGTLDNNTTGSNNTAIGSVALTNNTEGNLNTALGYAAGGNQTTGSNNVYIGQEVLGVAGESNSCYIGSIFGQTSINGTPVLINSSNKLGTTTSSKRFKEDIKPMAQASEALFQLKPVTFRYKKEIDPTETPQLGLVAEEVENVNPDLVVRDKEGKPYSVRYDQVNAMLLNEFLKEHRKVEQLRKDFESKLAAQQDQIEALTASLQKVSAQIQMSKVAPNVARNKP